MWIPWKYRYYQRRQWHPTPVLLPGKSHGWRRLAGCSPWGHEESDMTERLHFHFSLTCIGEGNGNPLQCSCLENPRDGGAWWAAVYGVAQSQTWLKRLSSSSGNSNGVCLQLMALKLRFFQASLSVFLPLKEDLHTWYLSKPSSKYVLLEAPLWWQRHIIRKCSISLPTGFR